MMPDCRVCQCRQEIPSCNRTQDKLDGILEKMGYQVRTPGYDLYFVTLQCDVSGFAMPHCLKCLKTIDEHAPRQPPSLSLTDPSPPKTVPYINFLNAEEYNRKKTETLTCLTASLRQLHRQPVEETSMLCPEERIDIGDYHGRREGIISSSHEVTSPQVHGVEISKSQQPRLALLSPARPPQSLFDSSGGMGGSRASPTSSGDLLQCMHGVSKGPRVMGQFGGMQVSPRTAHEVREALSHLYT